MRLQRPPHRLPQTRHGFVEVQVGHHLPAAGVRVLGGREVEKPLCSEAIRLGIHPRTLYLLRKLGVIERIGRGLYRLSAAPPLTHPDLVPIALRIPRAVACLISALAHSAGVEIVTIEAVPVRIYSPEKTIADCFKYRNKIGVDVAVEALRTYRERTRKPNVQAVLRYAQIWRAAKVMRPYLEAIL